MSDSGPTVGEGRFHDGVAHTEEASPSYVNVNFMIKVAD